jgi:hypothetical protein
MIPLKAMLESYAATGSTIRASVQRTGVLPAIVLLAPATMTMFAVSENQTQCRIDIDRGL